MKVRIVILTKSSKFGQYCVAGIDLNSGKWIRLVSTDLSTHGAIAFDDLCYENGQYANVLDVVDVEVKGYDNNPYQPENMIVDRSCYLKFVKHLSIDEAIEIYNESDDQYILGDTSYCINEDKVPHLGRSLTLAVVNNLYFDQAVNDEGKQKTKLSFKYNGFDYINMSVTDPRFYDIGDGAEFEKAVIVVSIGTPFRGKYYKFVSAIYPL